MYHENFMIIRALLITRNNTFFCFYYEVGTVKTKLTNFRHFSKTSFILKYEKLANNIIHTLENLIASFFSYKCIRFF